MPVSYYASILNHHWLKILSFIAICLIVTAVFSARITPIYESAATLEINCHLAIQILGQRATQYPIADSDQFLATQLKLIQSDSVLRPVVKRFQLPVQASGQSSDTSGRARADDAPVS